jgi:hypothetical protein
LGSGILKVAAILKVLVFECLKVAVMRKPSELRVEKARAVAAYRRL